MADWTTESLKEHFEQRFIDSEKAVKAALAAAERAVEKAEENSLRWQNNANEWRGSMLDREARFAARVELEAIEKRVSGLKESLNTQRVELMQEISSLRESRSAGAGEKGGRISQQNMFLVVIPALIASVLFIGGIIVAVAFAVRN